MSLIRKYEPEDFDHLKPIMVELQAYECQFNPTYVIPNEEFAEWYLSRLLDTLAKEQGELLVATVDQVLCGFAAGLVQEEWECRDQYFYIAELAVLSGFRGRGIGSALISAMEKEAQRRGLKRVGIGVVAASDRVHGFYRRLGYGDHVVSLRKHLLDTGGC